MLELIEKTDAEVAAWLPNMKVHYVDARVEAGEERASAQANADQQFEVLIPGGRAAEGQYVLNLVRDGATVGQLWMGRPLQANDGTWFVFFVEIDPALRGQGLGREAMLAAERWTVARGGRRIGLNVFGPNTVARNLYDSLGYQVVATNMMKELAGS